jgi:hypothetical protein
VLPVAAGDWATAIVGVIGIAAGTFGTLAGLSLQERLERSRTLREVADAFVAAQAGAMNAVQYAVDNPSDKEGFDNARHFVGAAAVPLGRVQLVFGRGRVRNEAVDTDRLLRDATEALEQKNAERARALLEQSRVHQAAFFDAVQDDVVARGSGWRALLPRGDRDRG